MPDEPEQEKSLAMSVFINAETEAEPWWPSFMVLIDLTQDTSIMSNLDSTHSIDNTKETKLQDVMI